MSVKIKGIKQVRSNIRKTISSIAKEVTRDGIYAMISQGAAYASALTPVDTANLINSQYITVDQSGDGWIGRVGYTANYAEPVHDGPDRNWQKTGASNLFLTKGFDDNLPKLVQILKASYKT
jgi:hypothetical protein